MSFKRLDTGLTEGQLNLKYGIYCVCREENSYEDILAALKSLIGDYELEKLAADSYLAKHPEMREKE